MMVGDVTSQLMLKILLPLRLGCAGHNTKKFILNNFKCTLTVSATFKLIMSSVEELRNRRT
jgi:hypothetical protein